MLLRTGSNSGIKSRHLKININTQLIFYKKGREIIKDVKLVYYKQKYCFDFVFCISLLFEYIKKYFFNIRKIRFTNKKIDCNFFLNV